MPAAPSLRAIALRRISPLLRPHPTSRFAFAHPLARPSGSACAEGSLRAPLFGAFLRGLPSSLAELSEHATLLCPAEFHPPKSVRRSPVGFIMSEQWPRGTLVTRLYERDSLALSLIRSSGETRAHRSPFARPVLLIVCRFLYDLAPFS